MLMFAMNVIQQVQEGDRHARQNAISNNQHLLQIMSEQVHTAFTDVNNTLWRAVDSQYYNEKPGGGDTSATMKNMQRLINESGFIAAMLLVDEKGQPVMAVHKKGYEKWINYNTRSFAGDKAFMDMVNHKDQQQFNELLNMENTSMPNLMLTGRKIKHADGSFAGAFIAAVDPQSFINYFAILEQGKNSYISLQLTESGMIAADVTSLRSTYAEINAMVRDRAQAAVGRDMSVVNSYKINDSVQIYGFLVSRSFPLVVTIVLDQSDYLKDWHETRTKDYGFLTIFIAFGSLLSFMVLTMARQIVRVEKSEAAAVLASQAKSEFLANMSHELRTPLNAIIGFSEMMNSGYFGQLNPRQKERIHDINLCGSHLLNLITDILEFSKGEAGKLEVAEEKIIMQELVNEAVRIIQEKVKSKHLHIVCEVDESIPPLLGDKRKIRQILLNLLSNSIKFTPEKGTIKIIVCQDASDNITMTVSDSGIGIAEKDIPVALSVFGQVHRSQSHEGTGLGLPICKMFAELHGGRLAFGSRIGEGTTVRITFPSSRNMTLQAK